MNNLLLAAAAVGALVWLGSAAPARTVNASEAERLAVLRAYTDVLEIELGWSGLSDFLTVVASQESGGRLDAVHDGGIGRGPYALHSTTTAVQVTGGLASQSDPRFATAAATLHAMKLLRDYPFSYPRADARWSDVRAGWAIPSWVGNRDALTFGVKTRAGVVQRHQERASRLGLSAAPNRLAMPSVWPTVEQVLAIVGGG